MPKFDWFWFLIGILFSMFIMPMISQVLGRVKGTAAAKKAV